MKSNKNINIGILLAGILCIIGACFLKDDYYALMLRSTGIAWVVSGGIQLKRSLYYAKPEHREEYEEKQEQRRINLKDERKIMLRQMAGHKSYQVMYFLLLGLAFVLALLRVEWWIILMVMLLWIFQSFLGIALFRYYDKRL